MQHRNVLYIFLFFFMVFFSSVNLWAGNLCAPVEQGNGTASAGNNANWKCPDLSATDAPEVNATLSDVDVVTGRYTCEYRYVDTDRVATSCTFISKDYKEALDEKIKKFHDRFKKAITEGDSLAGTNTIEDYEEDITAFEINKFAEAKEKGDITELLGYVANELTKMHTKFYDRATTKIGYTDALNQNVSAKLDVALTRSYNLFVKPYLPSEENNRSEETFSRFVTGLVTLDSNISFSLNEKDGNVIINGSKWRVPADGNLSTILNKFKKYAFNDLDADTDKAAISSWVDIFEQKIWGFYYNLQRRLDLGYDVIATQLLFIMMVFFSIGMAVKGGARYITNRENGHSSGEVKINEASIMKTLGILAAVFAFYISVPDPDNVTNRPTYDVQDEIRTNSSLSKNLIRLAMQKGSEFGTMISDLGSDAFLRYIVHQQGLSTGIKEGNNLIKEALSMIHYFPNYEILNECRFQSGLPDDMILSGNMGESVSPAFLEASKGGSAGMDKYDFYEQNNIVLISDALCQKVLSQTKDRLYEIAYNLEMLKSKIDQDMFLRNNATTALVNNHIALQEKLGWMNIASIPYTYFLMRNQGLFYESVMNFKEIKLKASKYASSLGLRSGESAIKQTMWQKKPGEATNRLKSLDKDAEHHHKEYTRLAAYNFLPGFTSIRNEVLQRVQGVFSDILRMQRAKDQQQTINDTLDALKSELVTMVETASRYYGDMQELYPVDEIKRQLDSAINNGVQNPIELHKAFIKISYLVAMGIWKSGFVLVFLSAIAMVIGLKIVMYIISVMVHFFISPFIVVWAFATSPDGGASKIKNYLRDTLIYMLYPVIIVIGVFMFIFAYELFYNIYGFITSMLIANQEYVVQHGTIGNLFNATYEDSELGMLAIYALKDFTEIMIDLVSVYVAFITINKFPEMVLKMMGVGDSAVVMLPQASEAIQSKGGGNVNPLSR